MKLARLNRRRLPRIYVRACSGQVTDLDYVGTNLSEIRVTSEGHTQTLTRYHYDSLGRLRQVVVDLTPQDDGVPLPDANDDDLYEGVNGQSHVTTYAYEGATHLINSVSQSDGSTVTFTYELIAGKQFAGLDTTKRTSAPICRRRCATARFLST